MTCRKFWYYWHTRNDSDSRNGWNASHSGHSGSWDRLYNKPQLTNSYSYPYMYSRATVLSISVHVYIVHVDPSEIRHKS